MHQIIPKLENAIFQNIWPEISYKQNSFQISPPPLPVLNRISTQLFDISKACLWWHHVEILLWVVNSSEKNRLQLNVVVYLLQNSWWDPNKQRGRASPGPRPRRQEFPCVSDQKHPGINSGWPQTLFTVCLPFRSLST